MIEIASALARWQLDEKAMRERMYQAPTPCEGDDRSLSRLTTRYNCASFDRATDRSHRRENRSQFASMPRRRLARFDMWSSMRMAN
jgi:hypothetical protein